MKRGLEREGFQVDAFNDPYDALASYKSKTYEFHVLDVRMPGMSGFALARKIWEQDPTAQVCFLSAFEIYENEARMVFKDFNTQCFVKKPITPTTLSNHLKMHLIKR
jgi:DNA-binding response OmpR family regulator